MGRKTEKEYCMICGQEIFEPLLSIYKRRRRRLVHLIEKSVREAYGDEEDADIFALGLVNKIEDELGMM